MDACRQIGVSFALDDFGTGYSSLIHLKHLSDVQLKIDRSFVRDMLDDPEDLAILEGVLGLATAFNCKVIAEGVETLALGKMLLQLGCELAQGYFIARPMPANELLDWSKTWRPDPTWINQHPFNHDDLPLLFASVEHRAWIRAVEDFLKGLSTALSSLTPCHCRFNKWLDGKGWSRYSTQPAFQQIKLLHWQVHALAAELFELHARGRNTESLARLGDLHDLQDAFLSNLNEFAKIS
jgi:hypothetical protein